MDAMEDLLTAAVEADGFSSLALVSTGEDLREWIYYTKSEDGFLARLNRALGGHPAFPIEIHTAAALNGAPVWMLVTSENRTALFHAVTYSRYDWVRFLAARGANLITVDTHGWSALDFANAEHNKRMIELLTELGAKSARKHEA